jgi:hypothetical protein
MKLKRTQPVCTEKEREKEIPNREKTKFFFIFFVKKQNSRQKKLKKNDLGPGPRAAVPWCPGTRVPILGFNVLEPWS